jgi:hypothetical protein
MQDVASSTETPDSRTRLANLLLRMKRQERNREAREATGESPVCHDVPENKGC